MRPGREESQSDSFSAKAATGGPTGAATKNVVNTFLGAPQARRRVAPPIKGFLSRNSITKFL